MGFLKSALGSKAVAKPTFDFKGTTDDPAKFTATSIVLEDTGVAAYNGQGAERDEEDARRGRVDRLGRGAPRRLDPRHRRRGARPRPPSTPSKTADQVLSAVNATGFIKG